MTHPLDNPAYGSLTGVHAGLAVSAGRALRFPADVSPFVALPDDPTAQDWADAARLAAAEGFALPGLPGPLPDGWTVEWSGEGVQLVATTLAAADDPEAVPLGPADVPDMLALTGLTKPGPFLPRTIELGSYLGIRRDGALIAMAGERLRPPGWTEISAVCTDPAWRGHGLASRLTRAVAAGITARGETPFLHAIGTNAGAIRLYKDLGFTFRRDLTFAALRPPATKTDLSGGLM